MDRMTARLNAIETLEAEAKRERPSEAVILAANLVLKYVKADAPQWLDKSQPKEGD